MKRSKSISWESIDDSTVVFDPNSNKMYTFDGIENFIWKNIDKTNEELAQIIFQDYEASYEQILKDINVFMDQLIEHGLIE